MKSTIMSANDVRAILEGRRTQFREWIKGDNIVVKYNYALKNGVNNGNV